MEDYKLIENGHKQDSTTTVALLVFCLMMAWSWLPLILAIAALAIPLLTKDGGKDVLTNGDELCFEEKSNLFVSRFNFGIMGSI